jgi:hypothetical protein
MITAVAAGVGHPVVAGLLGLGSAGLAGGVVAMTWSVHARQIRLAEVLARRQFMPAPAPLPVEPAEPALDDVPDPAALGHEPAEPGRRRPAGANGHGPNGRGPAGPNERGPARQNGRGPAGGKQTGPDEAVRAPANGQARAAVIDGPEIVVTGEQARYRVRSPGAGKVVAWAVGGGSVAQAPDPSHPDELLLIADQPGQLTLSVRVREGMTERRETKAVTVMADVPAPAPPFTLRLFLHGWGLIVAAVLIAGFAGALAALGTLTAADFIALVAPITALLGMAAVVRGSIEAPAPARAEPRRVPLLSPVAEYPPSPNAQPYAPPEPVHHN